jgi:hypothetical protein
MDNGRSSHPSSLFWKDHKSETLAEVDLENAAFTVFFDGRMIGSAPSSTTASTAAGTWTTARQSSDAVSSFEPSGQRAPLSA